MATAQSKYDLAPIQSSYVNDGGQEVASLLKQRYDANKQKYDMIERAAKNLDVLAGDQHHKDSAIQGINAGIENTVQRGNYESAGADIDELANSFATNQGLQASADSYAKRQEELKLQANIIAQGGQIIDFGNITDEEGNVIGHKSDGHQSYWTDENGEVHTDVYKGGAEHRQNTAEQMKKLIGNIASDSMALKRLDGEFAGLLQHGSQVTESKANRVAAGLYDSYLGTDAGAQQYRELTELNRLTDEQAQAQIVSEMQALAREQVGHDKRYMSDPNYVKATSVGNGTAAMMTGRAATSEGIDLFNNLHKQLTDTQRAMRAETDPEKKKLLADQLRSQTIKLDQAKTKAAQASPDKKIRNAAFAQAELFGADNNRFRILQSALESLTTQDSYVDSEMAMNEWNPFGDSSMGTYTNTSNTFGLGNIERPFTNVSLVARPEGMERDILKMQFADFDALNQAFGTDYTAADIPALTKLADDYYTFMDDGGGEDLRKFQQSTVEIKQDDRVVFGVNGGKEQRAVNDMLQQVNLDDFVILDAEGGAMSADAMETWLKELTDAQKNGKLKFGGLVMPNMWTGTEPSLFLEVGGRQVRALPVPTSSAFGLPAINQIAGALGLGSIYAETDAELTKLQAGEVNNGSANNRYMDFYGLSSKKNSDGEVTRVGLADMPGFITALENSTLSEWSIKNNLPPNEVMERAQILRGLENSMLSSISQMSNITWTEKELRDLDDRIGTPANLAEFERVKALWVQMPFNL